MHVERADAGAGDGSGNTGNAAPADLAASRRRVANGTPAYRRLAGALLLAGFSTFALLYDVQPLLPLFAARFAVDAAEASLAVSLTTGAMAFCLIPAGILSDRLGRRPVILASLFASAALTIASALLPGWTTLLAMRAATGIALAGVPSIAMAYAAEEVEGPSIGAAMGLYIAGSVIGSMCGRVGMSLVADLIGWRVALALMGVAGLASALGFLGLAPASRGFVPVRRDGRALLAASRRLLRDQALPLLYAEGFLLMGAFVTFYNYVGFRLQNAPYNLSQSGLGLVFLVYLAGSFSSAWFGGLAGRVGHRRVFWMPIAGLLAGVALTCAAPLAVVVVGIATVTATYFAAHSAASGWIGSRARQDRAQAAALYLFFYYLGSSILGSLGGLAWTRLGWAGIAAYAGGLAVVALALAARLAFVLPDAASGAGATTAAMEAAAD